MQDNNKKCSVDRQTMNTSTSNPAFKYPQGTELTEDQPNEVIVGIFAIRGLDFKKWDSRLEKISEAEFSQLMNDLKDAIYYYYPNTPRIEKLRKNSIITAGSIVKGYHANPGTTWAKFTASLAFTTQDLNRRYGKNTRLKEQVSIKKYVYGHFSRHRQVGHLRPSFKEDLGSHSRCWMSRRER